MGMAYDMHEVLHEVHIIKPRFHHFKDETLRLRVFRISREPQASRSHVTRALPSGLRFTFVRLGNAPELRDLPQGFLPPKTSQSHV